MSIFYPTLASRLSTTVLLALFVFGFWQPELQAQSDNSSPNILLIIADDLGVDVSNGYHAGGLMPNTPTLDSLRTQGITFENVWSAPVCTPTRAAIMSGKHGIKTGVLVAPGNLDTSHQSVLRALETQTGGQYADAVIGKWHISMPTNPLHPEQHGADFFSGVMTSGVSDYYNWSKTEMGMTTQDTNYVTTSFTNIGLDWVSAQDQPWFLWMAHVAPHTPIHVPPNNMFSIPNTGNNFRKYLAMIESLDFEIGRFLNSLPDTVRANTLVIYLGDNGTPNNLLRDYPDDHGKGSLYQGGIRVPMIIAGPGVDRKGERESALINVCDIYATILEITGTDLPGGIYNSLSFAHLLDGSPGPVRTYNYMELDSQWTIRTEEYKLLEHLDGSQEFYNLWTDSLEFDNLLASGLTAQQQVIKADLEQEAAQRRMAWSCRDHIQNGDEEGIDCGGTYCTLCSSSTVDPDLQSNQVSLFPNPGSTTLTINAETETIQQVRIYTALGQLAYSDKNVGMGRKTYQLAHLPPQTYTIEVELKDRIEVQFWVKQ